ncbi:MAG: AAA family ATPase [Aliishimia sp.]
MTAQIIILHGPSSSGKSTTAKAVQNAIDAPFLHFSIDHLRDNGVLPSGRISRGDFLWSDMRSHFFDGFHASLAAYAAAGNNLILEHIFDTPEWVADLKRLFVPFDVFFVGLHCDVEELRRRELNRGNRVIGSAVQDHQSVHLGRIYDIEIDNQSSTTQNAQFILDGVRSGIRTSEFANLSKTGP